MSSIPFSYSQQYGSDRDMPSDLSDEDALRDWLEDSASARATTAFVFFVIMAVGFWLYCCMCICAREKCGARKGSNAGAGGAKRLAIRLVIVLLAIMVFSGAAAIWAGEAKLDDGIDGLADSVVDGVDELIGSADVVATSLTDALTTAGLLTDEDQQSIEEFVDDISDIGDDTDQVSEDIREVNDARAGVMITFSVFPVVVCVIALAGMLLRSGWAGTFFLLLAFVAGSLIWLLVGVHDVASRITDDLCVEVDYVINTPDADVATSGLNDIVLCPDSELDAVMELAVPGMNAQIELLNLNQAQVVLPPLTEASPYDYDLLTDELQDLQSALGQLDETALDETATLQLSVIQDYYVATDELVRMGNCTLTNDILVIFAQPLCSDGMDGLIEIVRGGLTCGVGLLVLVIVAFSFFSTFSSARDVTPNSGGEVTSPRYAAPYTEGGAPPTQQELYPRV